MAAVLSPFRFIETASTFVGTEQTREDYLPGAALFRHLPLGATEEEWGLHFLQHVGVRSQLDASAEVSHWPLPLVRTTAELAEVAGEAGAMRETPVAGDVFLLWSPAKRGYVRSGIVVSVDSRRTKAFDGRVGYDCTTIECVANTPEMPLERRVIRRKRRFTPEVGDCVIRWTELEAGALRVFDEEVA